MGTLVHDGCQARQLEGKQGEGREGPPEEMRWATTEEVDSDDATMTRKTRNGKAFELLVASGVFAPVWMRKKRQDQRASSRD